MALEVEVKSWIGDHEKMREILDSRFTPVGEYSKHDVYFRTPSGQRYFRLRTQGEKQIVTIKKKTVFQGVEENEETEFTVSDRENFLAFLEALGCTVYIEKTKRSRVYRDKDLTVELSHIGDLGWFLEIEKLTVESISDRERREIRERLLGLLDDLGVGRKRIEGRYYIEMLAEKLMIEKERQ